MPSPAYTWMIPHSWINQVRLVGSCLGCQSNNECSWSHPKAMAPPTHPRVDAVPVLGRRPARNVA